MSLQVPALATLTAIRFGTGLPGQGPGGPEALIDELTAPDDLPGRFPVLDEAAAEALGARVGPLRKAARRREPGAEEPYQQAKRDLRQAELRGAQMTLARALAAPIGFRERLQWFWADHFTVRARFVEHRAMPQAFVEGAIRPHVAGRFADMLKAATLHPMMMVYLDQTRSVGPQSKTGRKGGGLNENLGRELLELHTLGVGAGYGQADVRQMSLLLTGPTWNFQRGWRFEQSRVEPGAETVLGRRYGGARPASLAEIDAALEDLALNPATAAHLSRKLAVHFCADQPDPDMVAAMTRAYRDNDGALLPVYAAMLAHPAAWAVPAQKIRQPWDFLVAATRALGVPAETVAALKPGDVQRRVFAPLRRMGQPWGEPDGPNGWPEEAQAWLTPQGLAGRIDWAMNDSRLWRKPPDPRLFWQEALGDAADETLVTAVGRSETDREGLALILASPAFNRR